MQTDWAEQKQALWARVGDYCRSQALLEQGGRVIAAVSGGADSMALLLFLLQERARWGLAVEAAHVNHGLRGAAAQADEAFVTAFCREHGVPLTVFRLAQEAPLPPGAGEDEARRARYACFDRLAAQKEARVATAHTLNDQAETLLFRLARGCGARGAGAIPPRRGPYIRPFLCLQRQDTEAICRNEGVGFCADETNDSDRYARNRLRRQALPALLAANEGALEAMGRFCAQMRELDGYLDGRGEILLEEAAAEAGQKGPCPEKTAAGARGLRHYSAARLLAAPAPEQAAALRLLLKGRFEPEARHLSLMEKALRDGGAVQLGPGLRFWTKQGGAFLEEVVPDNPAVPAPPQPFASGEYCLPGGYRLSARVLKHENFEKSASVHKKDLNYLADYDKMLQVRPILRTRRPGDVFRPAGRGLSKPLKKWLNEWKVLPGDRAFLPLVCGGGQVLWVWGQGFAQGLGPDESTRRFLRIECEKSAEV